MSSQRQPDIRRAATSSDDDLRRRRKSRDPRHLRSVHEVHLEPAADEDRTGPSYDEILRSASDDSE